MKTLQNKIKNSKRNMKDYDERLKLPIKTDAERKSERTETISNRSDWKKFYLFHDLVHLLKNIRKIF